MNDKSQIFLGNFQPIRLITHSTLNMHAIIGKRRLLLISEINDVFSIIGTILDSDHEETFMCCTFAKLDKKDIIVVAGQSSILKIIDPFSLLTKFQLKGHGGSINTIKSGKNNIVFTGSEDTSIRMWSLLSKRTICIFGGIAGHKDQVLSIDVSLCGKYLVSSSHDCTIKVWKIPCKCDSCDAFYVDNHSCDADPKKLITCHYPIFSSSEIHRTFITCVRFFGNFIVARGNTERFVIFVPEFKCEVLKSYDNSDCLFIDEYVLETTKLNFKFFVDHAGSKILIGSVCEDGTFHVCNLNFLDEKRKVYKGSSNRNSIIRDLTLHENHVYILYNDNVLEKIGL